MNDLIDNIVCICTCTSVCVCLFLFLASFPSNSLTSYKLLSLECTNTSIAFSLSHSPCSHHTHPSLLNMIPPIELFSASRICLEYVRWNEGSCVCSWKFHSICHNFNCLYMQYLLENLEQHLFKCTYFLLQLLFVVIWYFASLFSAMFPPFIFYLLFKCCHFTYTYNIDMGISKTERKKKVMCVAFIEPPPSPTPPPHYSSSAQKRERFFVTFFEIQSIAFSMMMFLKHCLRIYSSHNLIFSGLTHG